MSIAPYQGRRYDVLVLQGAKLVGEARLEQALFSAENGGQVCVGAVKLAQRWALEFLTEAGSMIYLPDRGSTFMLDAQRGALRTEADVDTAFKFASVDVERNLLNEEDDTWPDDERLDEAVLDAMVVSPGSVTLHVSITSLAGDARKVILPIPILP